ncbi:hypothetical protein O1L60_39145 [Streptomyces diastatochromogenes]|nr:hypothetical protein [Streptomyces diastatochromogenes]
MGEEGPQPPLQGVVGVLGGEQVFRAGGQGRDAVFEDGGQQGRAVGKWRYRVPGPTPPGGRSR